MLKELCSDYVRSTEKPQKKGSVDERISLVGTRSCASSKKIIPTIMVRASLKSFIHYVINSYTTAGYVLSPDRKTPSSKKTILQSLSTFQFATLNKRIAGFRGNSTLIILVPRHHDVAFHSPRCVPGVLDQPIVLATIYTVPNNKNTMVQYSAVTCSASK